MSWPQNIARSVEFVAQNVGNAVDEAAQHVSAENIAKGANAVAGHLTSAAEEVGKHANAETIAKAGQDVQNGLGIAAQELGKAAEMARPHMESAASAAKEMTNAAYQHVTSENIAQEAEKVGENIASGSVHAARHVTEMACANPVAAGLIGTGLVMAAAPILITAPVMAVAGAVGFTSTGVAAGSAAAGIQAGIGNVVGPSIFATFQSAAAGGYGVAAISGAVQAVGGVFAGSGAVVKVVEWWKGNENSSR